MSFKKIFKIIICLLVTATVLAVAVREVNDRLNKNVFLREYTFASASLPASFDGYKVFLISDLHNAPFSDQIVRHIRETEPDIVVLTGDLVQLPEWKFDRIEYVLKELDKKIPVYAVSGNHETQNDEYDYIRNEISYLGVKWLENKSTIVEKNGDAITIAGIKDPKYDDVPEERCNLIAERIKNELVSDSDFSILLSHRASLYPYIKDSDADLILSGHLHGGLIKLPFVGGVVNEDGEFGTSPYSYGYVREGESSSMIVSGGCDQNPQKKRWFNPPEVLLITLERGE